MSKSFGDWTCNLQITLSEGGCKTLDEWVVKHAGVHCWSTFGNTESCACCGVVRRADDSNKPCRGLVAIKMR